MTGIFVNKLGRIDWDKVTPNFPETMEQKYYRYIFENEYKNCGNVIPYFWMPKYVTSNDPVQESFLLSNSYRQCTKFFSDKK